MPPASPFALGFFGGFRRQREALQAAVGLAPIPVAAPLAETLDRFGQGLDPAAQHPGSSSFWATVKLLRPILTRTLAIGVAARLVYIAMVTVGAKTLATTLSLGQAIGIALAYLALNVLHNTVTYWSDRNRAEAVEGACLVIVARLCAKLRRIDTGQLPAQSTATLKVLILSDVAEIHGFLTAVLWNGVPVLVALAAFGPMIVHHAGLAGALGIVVALLNVPVSIVLARWMGRQQGKQQVQLDAMTEVATEWIQNLRLVRYLGWQTDFTRELRATLDRYMRPYLRRHALACLTFGISFAWWTFPILAMLAASPAREQAPSLTGIFVAIWLLRDMSEYLQHMPYTFSQLASARVAAGRIAGLMATPDASEQLATGAAPPSSVPRRLILQGVGVQYRAEGSGTEALRSLELTLDLGAKTAIVGRVGSGKSTLLKVLAGELKPSQGKIMIEFEDGTLSDLWTVGTHDRFRAHLASSPQEPFISNDTLATNVTLDEDQRTSAILAALQVAAFAPDLETFPQGLDEEIGERGLTLSGGQRQRLALARALHATRPILLLDDILSAVDPRTEEQLVQTLRRQEGGVLLVSHRLAHLDRFDRVLVLDQGRLVEDGTPAELAGRGDSQFAQLARAAGMTGARTER